jgi:hypothetical protein
MIQNQAQVRNVDSKTHPRRFYRFKFQFHSFCLATFATQSPRKRKYIRHLARPQKCQQRSWALASGHGAAIRPMGLRGDAPQLDEARDAVNLPKQS